MSPGDTEHNEGQNTNELNMQRLAEQAVQEIISKIQAIEASDAPTEQKVQQKTELANQTLRDYRIAQEAFERLKGTARNIPPDELEPLQELLKEKQRDLRQEMIKVTALADKDIKVTQNTESQKILKELAKTPPSESEAIAIQDSLGNYLLGEEAKEIIISTGDQKSDFQTSMDNLKQINESAHRKLAEILRKRASDFNLSEDQMAEALDAPPIEDLSNPFEGPTGDREAQYTHHDKPLYSRFTKEDQEFLHQLYTVDRFKENIVKHYQDEIKEHHLDHIKDKISKAYNVIGEQIPTGELYDQLVDKQVKIEASEEIAKKLIDIMNKLYWRVHIDRPHKFFEEIEKEDFMTGIETTRMKIMNTLENLQHSLEDEERIDEKQGKQVERSMYKHGEKDYVIEEKKFDTALGEEVNKPFMRTSPLPEFREIKLSEYVQSLISNLTHWRHRSEYLHNARAIFNHPAHGDKGFFSNLGGYAENLSGTDVDEMMLLPDGQMVLDAFILYDKLVEEEFASQDWKHRPNQFTNSLEEVNTKVEKEVISRLQGLYKGISDDELRHAVNSAVGMARGVFLNETEKSAYADAVDPKGGGMFASYATNDATALQTFNPLHVMLRWQGEHMLPMFYFMNVKGSGSTWDHKKTWENGAKFLKSFLDGKGSLQGQDLFIDQLVDNMSVGGILKRRGWRMAYSLEGHFVYKAEKSDKLDYLETFKAMDAIGYEAIFDLLDARVGKDKGLLKHRAGSAGAKDMDDLFGYIFNRYFVPLDKNIDYQDYMKKLRKKGEEEAWKYMKSHKKLNCGSFEEEINYQTGQLFIQRALAREVALRFPSKLLRIDRDRYTEDGVSRYSKIQRDMGLKRSEFHNIMRDFSFAEMLLRREMSETIKNAYFTEIRGRDGKKMDIKLNNITDYNYHLNEESIARLLKGKISDERIQDVIKLYKKMNEPKNALSSEFLDGGAFGAIKNYKFSFGLEDTDFTLMAMRSTGPRMIARSINDTAQMESITPWIINMPRVLNQIATSGKKDFTPIIEYLQKAQNAFTSVHGTGADFQYIYKIASACIQYFKKDTAAKPFLGLFRIGKRNSIAAEYAGRSTAVWEWDARDIDRFITSMESLRLLPRTNFNVQEEPKYEDRWISIFGRPVRFGKQQVVAYPFSGERLRKEFGATYVDMAIETVSQYLPIVLAMILWKYIEDAMKEAEGKKK